MIPFCKPYLTGKELDYIKETFEASHISGDGKFTNKCHHFFEKRYGFKKCLLTTSCTHALEMAAILIGIKPGDEVIMPSYTFVSTANAFVLRGAKVVFADSREDHPCMDEESIEELVTERTKAIVPVHYAGIACRMDKILNLAEKYNLFVIEDAAHAIDSYYTFPDGTKKPLGSIGHLAAFSFHATKNIVAGEGGMLVINDERFIRRAEIIREKGTNRTAFFRKEISKYTWVDIGSSFLPSDMISAFLYAQLENLNDIQLRRKMIWSQYYEALFPLHSRKLLKLPSVPGYATNNFHIFYLLCNTPEDRISLMAYLKENKIEAVFHYLSLHKSEFYVKNHDSPLLPFSDYYSKCLIRLPFYYELTFKEINFITTVIKNYFESEEVNEPVEKNHVNERIH